jgi:NADH-quinone oxidoreductase subunit A
MIKTPVVCSQQSGLTTGNATIYNRSPQLTRGPRPRNVLFSIGVLPFCLYLSSRPLKTNGESMQPIDLQGVLSPWQPGVFSLTLYGVVVIGLTMVLLFLSRWLGQHQPNDEKLRVYESGIIPTGQARLRYPVPFFMVAIFFLIFDVEGAYIFSWAVASRPLGWAGWFQIQFFIGVLIAGLVYVWVKGGLDWGPKRD